MHFSLTTELQAKDGEGSLQLGTVLKAQVLQKKKKNYIIKNMHRKQKENRDRGQFVMTDEKAK